MTFSEATQRWFDSAFDEPTAAQREGWAAIGRGEHTLILAPTGSGKTLAAFLSALDRLLTRPGSGCRVLYVSPLKALGYDVERNLQVPLAGISAEAARRGIEVPRIRVATRTGDTPAEQRRTLGRNPPDILITTPESLYLMLTSRVAATLTGVELVIVDEIHAMAATKRGAHLALSLERLESLVTAPRAGDQPGPAEAPARPPQRIGLSATQRPLEEIARFLGGQVDGRPRPVTVVDAGMRKTLDLSIVVPVEDMARPGGRGEVPGDGQAAPADLEDGGSIWPAVYPRLLELIRAHRSTLIFVNSRRLAERLAARLNELAAEDDSAGAFARSGAAFLGTGADAQVVRAHHGSIAREQRQEIEEALKSGQLAALVATSSLELGIDMGDVDLVVQVEAPTSVAAGLQRIGRAGHQVGAPSVGRVFPKFRHDLLVAAVVAQRMHAGLIEETRVPSLPLDVLAQQIVAHIAAEGPVTTDELYRIVGRAYPFAGLSPAVFEGVLDMLAGRYPSDEFAELRPRLVWDRVAGRLEARPGAQMLAVVSGGTIPDRGLFGVFTAEGGRVGELDEEMVYESRVGETFLLGASTWRIVEITRDRVVVVPAPGLPGRMPFWHGDGLGRPYELGEAVGAFTRTLAERTDAELAGTFDLDPLAARNLRAYVAEESEATGGVLPTDRRIVVERFRDELGDWQIAVLSPFGGRVHAPWALAIEARLAERTGAEVHTVWSDDGIIVRLPDVEEEAEDGAGGVDPGVLELIAIDPADVEGLVVGALRDSSLFAGRFRENAARSLLLPRRRPGSRTPLWQMRQRAADLLAVASRHPSFPVLLETYRECLRDVFDLPALRGLLAGIAAGRVELAAVELASPSPFAGGLVSAYVAQFMYEGDAPLAERRAQALTLDRRMLAELLGTDELRDLLDAGVVEAVELELQSLGSRRARDAEGVADLLRRLGDLSPAEIAERCGDGRSGEEIAGPALAELLATGRAIPIRVAGEERFVAVEDAARYRDALGVSLPEALPDPFLDPAPDALVQLVRRWARTHGPFRATEPAARLGLAPSEAREVLARLAVAGRVVRGAFRPGAVGEEWCDTEVLRTLRERSLAALRRQVEPAARETLAGFGPAWQRVAGVAGDPPAGGPARLMEVVAQLEGVPIPASVLERDVLPSRVRAYSPRMLDEVLASGEVMWIGAGALPRGDGRVVLARRDGAGLVLPAFGYAGEPSAGAASELHDHVRSVLAARGACFFRDLARPGATDAEILDALWDLVWAGEVTGDSFAAVRAGVAGRRASGTQAAGPGPFGRPRPRPGRITVLGPPRGQGRWSLVKRELGPTGGAAEAGVALASVLLDRHGIVTRSTLRAEGVPGGFAGLYPVLRAMEESGRVRRGYFVAGMGAAQFARPAAVDRLRAVRDAPGNGPRSDGEVLVLAATDPANVYGASLPWPVKGPTRVPGAYVVLASGGRALAYLERGGRGLVALAEPDGTWEEAVVATLAGLVRNRRWPRLVLQRYPEPLEAVLLAEGFTPSPRGLVHYGASPTPVSTAPR